MGDAYVKRLLALFALLLAVTFISPAGVRAVDIGDVHGVVHDAQHRPIGGASVQLKAATADWSRTT
jgi:hypothetical protein